MTDKLALAHGAMIQAERDLDAAVDELCDRIDSVKSSLAGAIQGDLSAATVARPAIMEFAVKAAIEAHLPAEESRVVAAIMKASGGTANPTIVRQVFQRLMKERQRQEGAAQST